MVEEKKNDGMSKSQFPESVNVPLMASINLSKVFLDPQIGDAYTSKEVVIQEHLYSTNLWGQDKIKTLDDLELEMAAEEMADVDNLRADLSDDDDEDDEP